jgi:hypothetical protein
MRILAAFICMSLIGVVATVLAVISALIQMLPVILAVLAVFGALRWWTRRAAGRAGVDVNAGPPAVIVPPAVQPCPIAPRPAGWVLMPVWMPASDHAERHRYIDAEIIGEDNHHD